MVFFSISSVSSLVCFQVLGKWCHHCQLIGVPLLFPLYCIFLAVGQGKIFQLLSLPLLLLEEFQLLIFFLIGFSSDSFDISFSIVALLSLLRVFTLSSLLFSSPVLSSPLCSILPST